jgi:hypothetical protein
MHNFLSASPPLVLIWPQMCLPLFARKQYTFWGLASLLTRRLGGQCRSAQALRDVEKTSGDNETVKCIGNVHGSAIF